MASQRSIIIPLSEEGLPITTIKAGFSMLARNLIHKEHQFLCSIPERLKPFAPRPGPILQSEAAAAFAMEFIPGSAPDGLSPETDLSPFLSPWVDQSRTTRIDSLPQWPRLVDALRSAGRELPPELRTLGEHRVHPALFHGDFAPWNMRIGAVSRAIDWERGELEGIPGWDWFHFHMQTAALLGHQTVDQMRKSGQAMLQTNAFLRYATGAQIENVSDKLLRAYLVYNWYVLQPTERSAVARTLAEEALLH